MATLRFDPELIQVGNAGPYTGSGNNTYLIAGDARTDHAGGPAATPSGREALLIDAGIGSALHVDRLATALERHGARLAHVLVTHAHLDHASGAPALAQRLGVNAFSKYAWPEHDIAGVDWQHLADGAAVDIAGIRLSAVHTPGHSPDHLSFWHEPTRTVFSGDLVNAQTSVAIIHSRGGDLGQYLASLERVLALGPARLLPGHGPAIEQPARVLRMTIEHRRTRDRQVARAVRAGHETVHAITESIYHGLSPELMPLARENVRAHLEQQRREGRVAVDGERWHAAPGAGSTVPE